MYSETRLIRHATGENICVELHSVKHIENCQKARNQPRITQGNGFHRCWIGQGLLYLGYVCRRIGWSKRSADVGDTEPTPESVRQSESSSGGQG